MNRIGIQTRRWGSRALRVLITGTVLWVPVTLVRAQEPQQEDRQQEPPRPEEHAKPPAQTPPRQEPEQRETAKPPSQEERQARPPEKQAPPASHPDKEDRNQNPARAPQHEEPSDQRNARIEHAGGSMQKRVPDPEFREHFGRAHHFRIAQPVVVAGYPRFQYSGFWFVIVDPWPAVWLYTDDFYIDYVDGAYYLCDVAHPDVLVLVSVA